jgi:hypothetical protein
MIKNKNGKEYKVSKPNPLMKFQELWEKYTIHNFFWQELKEINFFKETKKEEKINQTEKKTKEKKIEQENKSNKQITLCWYVEAETTSKKDELYEEIKTKITYKEKKLIEIKIEEYNDLYLNFSSKEELLKNSIIFIKNKDKRWWKIKKEQKLEEEKYFYFCIPSDLTPSLD